MIRIFVRKWRILGIFFVKNGNYSLLAGLVTTSRTNLCDLLFSVDVISRLVASVALGA